MKPSHTEQMFELMSQGIWQVDAAGKTTYVNSRMSAIVGYSREELALMPALSLAQEADRGWIAARIASRRQGVRDDYECQIAHRDGSWVSVLVEATPLYRDDGAYDGTLALVTDVTERKHTEEQLHASDARFRTLIAGVKDYATFLLDADGKIASWNAGAEVLKGYTAAEIIGQHFSVFYAAQDRERGEPDQELKVAAAEGLFEVQGWRLRKDGSRFWANVVITPVRDLTGNLVGFTKVTRDLSERKAAEKRLQLVEAAPDGIILADRDGRIVHANPQTTRLFGYPRDELVGRLIEDLVPERFRPAHRSHRADFEAAPRVRLVSAPASNVLGLRMDGTEFPAEISLSTQVGPEGVLFIAFIRDVTDQRRMQRDDPHHVPGGGWYPRRDTVAGRRGRTLAGDPRRDRRWSS
jgi:PAS domain S-box-containing protein